MYDKKKDEYIFVEVKTRTNKNFGTGEVSITKTKFEKILKAAEDFFRKKLKTYEIPFFRVDAVIIEIEQGEISCEHLPNIGWEDF
ncbi:YraN family protein [Candidatus Gracilibacteria bacterium]|nr:YraN family protein [Candidatus Gracilibacteria bacterium]MCF7819042.1 YraN family protein [Candidatus Gracilibacteria bacterium]